MRNILSKKHVMEELDEFHYHEILDRTYCLLEHFDLIQKHPVYKTDKKFRKLIGKSMKDLSTAYQHIGMKRFYLFDDVIDTSESGEDDKVE